jgi:hypothetical protein
MRPIAVDFLKTLFAIAISVVFTTLVGSFIATPVNPTESRQVQAKFNAAVETGMVFREGEAEAYLDVPKHPDPPFWAAVLDWHAWLLAPGLILAFLILKPSAVPALLVSLPAAVFLYYFVAPNPAIVLLASSVLGVFAVHVLAKSRKKLGAA